VFGSRENGKENHVVNKTLWLYFISFFHFPFCFNFGLVNDFKLFGDHDSLITNSYMFDMCY
jgi:hypothetical protein